MKAFKVFILGLLYGWLLKSALDRVHRGNEVEEVRNENASLREHIRSLETRRQPKSLEAKSVKRAAAQTSARQDDLKVIKGIGPVIEKKLNNAGIRTFAALAQLTVEDLENILGRTSRLAREGNLIAQAGKLAKQKA